MDEADLIARCKRGDAAAQRALYDSLADAMMPLCLRYIRRREEAEDALLAGFFKAFRAMGRYEYRGRGSLEAWLKRIMVTECLMRLRDGKKWETVAEEWADGEVCEAEDSLQKLAARDLFRLIAALPDGCRTVFNLYAVEGYTHREIAGLLGITEGGSKSQYSRARASLRAAITQQNRPHHVPNE